MRRALCVIALTLLAAVPLRPDPSGEDRLEYQVKAAFLFNFLKFIEWPPTAGDGPWVIGVLGTDPFGQALDQTVRGKIVNGRPVEVRRYSRLSEVKDCNILFIGRAAVGRIGIPVQPGLLTVGEAPGFLKAGGIVNFQIDDNRVRFEIQPAAARSAGLRVSAQLLKLGRAF
ncbi:MAG: YfiR family protein [Bryobacteraceae bacterium]